MGNAPIIKLRVERRPEALALFKVAPQQVVDGTFGELVGYLSNPEGDEFNPSYDNEDQRRLAGRIRAWKDELTANPEAGSVNLHFIDENDNLSQPIDLEARVREHLGRMVKSKVFNKGGERESYQEVDLLMQYNPVGGYV